MSSLAVITDPHDELSRRVSWQLEHRKVPHLVLLEDLADFEGYPPEVEYAIARDDDHDAITRIFEHGDAFLMTPRGGLARMMTLGSKLHGRIAILAMPAADEDLEDSARNVGATMSIARYDAETDLDQAAETLALLLSGSGLYMWEVDLNEPLMP